MFSWVAVPYDGEPEFEYRIEFFGHWAAVRVLCVNEPKNTGARSARVRSVTKPH